MDDKERYEHFNQRFDSLLLLINTKFDGNDKQLDNIDEKIDGVKDHLKTLNGKVAEHERIINEAIAERATNREWQKSIATTHFINCPHKVSIEKVAEKVEALQIESISNKAIKKWLIGAIGITAIITGIIFEVLNHYFPVK